MFAATTLFTATATTPNPQTRQTLNADALNKIVRQAFARVPDHRGRRSPIALVDALMSAYAMFALKDSSLLQFDQRRHDQNLHTLYGIVRVPSDTQMRELLDPIDPDALRPVFTDLFRVAQRDGLLRRYAILDGHYLVALDGTGYYSSTKVHCEHCQQKVSSATGAVTYEHHLLGAVLLHPDRDEVIPLAPEPIARADGSDKNDSERSAARRLVTKLRADHPKLPLILVEDGLASNGPHIQDILAAKMHFILGCQEGDHKHLYAQLLTSKEQGGGACLTGTTDAGNPWEIYFVNGIPLNAAHPDLLVNVLEYYEHNADGDLAKRFCWVTDILITTTNALILARAGRRRWGIENETFNTLKNQGYDLEHNYGHGQQNLSFVMAFIMMICFLVDQLQQAACPLFQAVLHKLSSKKSVWDNLRSHFRHFRFGSLRELYLAILHDRCKEIPLPSAATFAGGTRHDVSAPNTS